MKKKTLKKLALNRETILSLASGGDIAAPDDGVIIITRPKTKTWQTNEISICKYCTTPLDTCPDPTIA